MGRPTREQQLLGCAVGTLVLWALTGLFLLLVWVLPGTPRRAGEFGVPSVDLLAFLLPGAVAFLGSLVVGVIAFAVAASRRDWIELLCLGIITGLGILSAGVLLTSGGLTGNALVEAVFLGGSLASDHPFIGAGSYLLIVLVPLASLRYGRAVGDAWRGKVLTAVGLKLALTIVVAIRQIHP